MKHIYVISHSSAEDIRASILAEPSRFGTTSVVVQPIMQFDAKRCAIEGEHWRFRSLSISRVTTTDGAADRLFEALVRVFAASTVILGEANFGAFSL